MNSFLKGLIMGAETPSPKRQALCSRANADRIAYRLCDTSEESVAVVRTGDTVQPYRVVPVDRADADRTELEVHML